MIETFGRLLTGSLGVIGVLNGDLEVVSVGKKRGNASLLEESNAARETVEGAARPRHKRPRERRRWHEPQQAQCLCWTLVNIVTINGSKTLVHPS